MSQQGFPLHFRGSKPLVRKSQACTLLLGTSSGFVWNTRRSGYTLSVLQAVVRMRDLTFLIHNSSASSPRSTSLFHTTAHTKTGNRISQVSISILKSVIVILISFWTAGFVASCADIAFKNKLLNDRYKTIEDEEKDVSSSSKTLTKREGKEIPLEAWTGPAASRRLRFPAFKTTGTWRWYGC